MKPIRIGAALDGRDMAIDLGEPYHVGITGATRAGKSSLTYTLIAGLAGQEHVVFAGVDPTGILFNPLDLAVRDWRVSTMRDPARVGVVVDALVERMDQRISRLLGEGRDKFSEPTAQMPLIVCVFEEYASMMSSLSAEDRATGAKIGQRLQPRVEAGILRLVAESAKVLMRVVIVTQHASADVLTSAVRSQLAVRCSFRQPALSLRFLHDDLPETVVASAQSFTPGQAIIETPGQALQIMQADLCEYEDYRRYLNRRVG